MDTPNLSSTTDPFAPQAVDPFACFDAWYAQAKAAEPNDPNAMALATATPAGRPSVRMVLLKGVEDGAFLFYTNAESRKGREINANPQAAICLHWKSLRRQVRMEGPITPLSAAHADAYFHSRSRGSQLGAVASDQSRPLPDRTTLERRAAQAAAQYPGEIARPPYWKGFALRAENIEFWRDGTDRLHERIVFTRKGASWSSTLLYP